MTDIKEATAARQSANHAKVLSVSWSRATGRSLRLKSAIKKLTAVVSLLLVASCPVVLAQSAALSWVDTDTHALSSLLSTANDLGNAPANTPLSLLVSLKLQNTSVLYGYFQHITTKGDPLFGQYLRPDQFAASYSPTMAQASQVTAYLQAMGFKNITLSPNRTVIRMDGTVGLAQAAFNTRIDQFQLTQALGSGKAGSSVLANTTAAQVPAQLGNLVLSVAGLNTIPNMHLASSAAHPAAAQPAAGAPQAPPITLGPQQFQTAYDADPAVDGSKTPIAIIAEGDLEDVPATTSGGTPTPGVLSDLRLFEDNYKLPHVPYTVIPTGTDLSDDSGATEFDMDTQTSTGIAGNVLHLYIYDSASLSDVELVNEFNRFVTDDLAVAGSASFGGCEILEYENGEISAYDQVYLQMATQGQTMFASQGDGGSACMSATNGVPGGVPGVEFPGSSTYVMSAGGTTLTVNSDYSYNTEIAWDAGGGGISMFESAGPWQSTVVPAYVTGLKGVPDVAMDADFLLSAAAFYSGGQPTTNGGTSLSSPLSLGSWARMQSAHDNMLGYAPPDLYGLGTAPLTAVPGFNDIIIGNNAGYSATPGWDYTTGLGSFDIAAITKLLTPVTGTLPPAPMLGGDPCKVPGDLLAVGVANSQSDKVPGHNVLDIYVAEPDPKTTNNADSFVFTMTVDSLALAVPETLYIYYFYLPDGSEHYVAYETTTDPAATSAFTYGTVATLNVPLIIVGSGNLYSFAIPSQVGYTDTGSMLDTTNNQITWVLAKSKIAGYVEDTTALSRMYGEVDAETTPVADNQGAPTNTPVDDTPQGNYTPVGNAACTSATAAGGSTMGGTTGGTSTGVSSTGGTTGGSSTGGTSDGTSTGVSSGGTTTGGTTAGGSSTGGSSGGSGTSSGASAGSSTGGTTGSSVTTGSSGTTSSTDTLPNGGAFGWEVVAALSGLAGLRRRSRRLK